MKSKTGGGVFDTLKTFVYAILIALLVRSVAFEPFNIPSGSMIPTLLVGDYLFVSKYSYGYSRYSLPFGLPLFSGRILAHQPERGDVIVFKLPSDPSTDYIKRVIGLPGDKIQVTDSILQINGEPVKLERIEDAVDNESRVPRSVPQFIETLPNGRTHHIWQMSDHGPLDNTPVYEVPPDHYFMMGDNRDNSQDSRVLSAVGYVPFENLVGRADFLFFSTDGSAPWWEFWWWPFEIRYSRLFKAVN